jgi:starch phosphorylase
MVRLAEYASDAVLQERFGAVKRANKVALAHLIYERMGVLVDPNALFDVQIKRIHEYKRQLLNLLETIALYSAMRAQPNGSWVPRVKIFAGKAAASYVQAKLIIKLANDVAKVVNQRSGRPRYSQSYFHSELQREPGRDHHSGSGPI